MRQLLQRGRRALEYSWERVLELELVGDGFGIAFRQRDKELAQKFNDALATLKENGTYDEIFQKYFGTKKQ